MSLKHLFLSALLFFYSATLPAQDTAALMRQFNSNAGAAEKTIASQALARYYGKTDINKAIYWANAGIAPAKVSKDDSLLWSQYDLLSDLQEQAGDVEDAIATLELSMAIKIKKDKKKELAISYNNVAILYGKINNYEQQTDNYIKAQKIYESIGLKEEAAEVEANMGAVYVAQGNYSKAIELLKPLMLHFQGTGNLRQLANLYGNIGFALMKTKQPDSAFRYSVLQIDAARTLQDADLSFRAWAKYGSFCSMTGKMKEFKRANDSMVYYAQQSGNMANEAQSYSNLGMYYATVAGDLEQAMANFEKALAIGERAGDKRFIVNTINNVATCHDALGDYAKAFKLMERAYKLKDSVVTEAGQEKIAAMQTRYQTEKKEAQIKLLDNENKLQRRNSYLLIMGLCFLALVGFVLYRNNVLKQRNNQKLQVLNAALNEANQSKAKLFSILSHDLRSPVSDLFSYLQLQKIAPQMLSEEKKKEKQEQLYTSTDHLLNTVIRS